MNRIAILGMGAMGSRMASNFLKQGYTLNIWNRSTNSCKALVEQGAKQFLTPKEAVQNVDVVIGMLTNDEASKDVWLNKSTGALLGLHEKSIAIECSTLSLDWCLELSSKIKAVNAEFLDAPVVGSRPQAEASQLIHLVGGDKTVFEMVFKILSVNASSIHYVGKIGSGMSMKLAVNGLFGMQVIALSEILGVLNNLGITKDVAVNLLNELPTTSPALKGIGMAISANNFDPLFPIDLVEKDFSYLEQLSESKIAQTPAVSVARSIYQKAQESGYGKDNIAGVAQLYI